jgi:2-aminoethylphosphonate-pyruvate transaminase
MKTQKHLLFCPGPVNTAANVKDALISYEIGHREKEFEAIFKQLQNKILKAFEIKNRKAYTPVVVTGSGSAANEAVISSIVAKKKILVLSNGEFGDRLIAMSALHNKHTYSVKFAWGETMNIAEIEKAIIKHKIEVIAMTHHETCTGKINPINEIGALTKKYDITFFVDTVSGAGADKLEIEKANISFVSTSASKALGSVPGLSIVIGKNEAFEAIKEHPAKTMYLNLYKFYHYASLNQTPNTPAVQLSSLLKQQLIILSKKGQLSIEKKFMIEQS